MPFIVIGEGTEMSFRISASMAPTFAMMILIEKYMYNVRRKEYKKYLLVLVIIIGAVTPAVEYKRAFETIVKTGKIDCVSDDVQTFNTSNALHNFVTTKVSSNMFYNIFLESR